ncbi:ribonuclease P protein component [Candidatus Kaiserbacteria bacterium]|nr:ribonuclease P protein component [Candidatus Kaiserbacteria bacterium]
MPTKFRLTRADFKLFSSQKTRRVRGVFFTLSIFPLPVDTPPKAACIVSKKVSRKAVDRNLIKRRFRAVLQGLMPQVKQPLALAFYTNSSSTKATFEQLSEDVAQVLKVNGILK